MKYKIDRSLIEKYGDVIPMPENRVGHYCDIELYNEEYLFLKLKYNLRIGCLNDTCWVTGNNEFDRDIVEFLVMYRTNKFIP